MYIYICPSIYLSTYVCVYVYTYIFLVDKIGSLHPIYVCVCVCVNIYSWLLYVYICIMCVCMCIYIYSWLTRSAASTELAGSKLLRTEGPRPIIFTCTSPLTSVRL
jgi:hypothetical protein